MTLLRRWDVRVVALAVGAVCLSSTGAFAQSSVTLSVDLDASCGDATINANRSVDTGTTVTVGFAVTVEGGLGGYSITFPSWPGVLEYVANSAAVCEGFSLSGVTQPSGEAPAGTVLFRATAVRQTNINNPSNTIVLTVQYNAVANGTANFDDVTLRNSTAAPTSQRPTFTVNGATVRVPHTINSAVLTIGSIVVPTNTPTTAPPTATPTNTVAPPTNTPTDTVPAGPTDTPCPNCSQLAGALIMDTFGGIHAPGSASANNYRAMAPYWAAPGLARDLVVSRLNVERALVMDLYGGVHYVNWPNAQDIVNNTSFYYFPNDLAVDAELSWPNNDGAYILARTGRIDMSGTEALNAPLVNTNLLFDETNFYVDLELNVINNVVVGYWLLTNRGIVVTSANNPAGPSLAEQVALLGSSTGALDFVDLEVVRLDDNSYVWIALRSDGTLHHSRDDLNTPELEPLPEGTDLTELPFFGFPGAVRDMEYQTAAMGATSTNDPTGSKPGVVLMDSFGRLYGTRFAEVPSGPVFGAGLATSLELADFTPNN